MSGFTPYFEVICEHLRHHAKAFSRVAVGASCEPWVNAEVFQALNWSQPGLLEGNESALAENRKRDIVIKIGEKVSCVIEVKVIYPWPEIKIKQEKLVDLKRQIDREMDDELPDAKHVGLIFLIWDSAMKTQRKECHRKNAASFFTEVCKWVEAKFKTPSFAQIESQMIKSKEVVLAGNPRQVNIVALYISSHAGQVGDSQSHASGIRLII